MTKMGGRGKKRTGALRPKNAEECVFCRLKHRWREDHYHTHKSIDVKCYIAERERR